MTAVRKVGLAIAEFIKTGLADVLEDTPDKIVRCPNCGCDYKTAKDLREWKDEPTLPETT
jgi:hypothetical protein